MKTRLLGIATFFCLCAVARSDEIFRTTLMQDQFLVPSKGRLNSETEIGLTYSKIDEDEPWAVDGYVFIVPQAYEVSYADLRRLSWEGDRWTFGKKKFALSGFEAISPLATEDPSVFWDPVVPYATGSIQISTERDFNASTKLLIGVVPIFLPDLSYLPPTNNGYLRSKNRYATVLFQSVDVKDTILPMKVFPRFDKIPSILFTNPKLVLAIKKSWGAHGSTNLVYSYGPEPKFRLLTSPYLDLSQSENPIVELDANFRNVRQHVIGFDHKHKIRWLEIEAEGDIVLRENSTDFDPSMIRNNYIFGALKVTASLTPAKVWVQLHGAHDLENVVLQSSPKYVFENYLRDPYISSGFQLDLFSRKIQWDTLARYGLMNDDSLLYTKMTWHADKWHYGLRTDLLASPRAKGFYAQFRTSDKIQFSLSYDWDTL